MSYIFTYNMAALRALTFYNSTGGNTNRSRNFVDTAGNTFSGYYGYNYTNNDIMGNIYSANILGYSPLFYISSNSASLSRNDYAIPDDAVSVIYTTTNAVADNDGVSNVFRVTYTNTTEETVTINKVLIEGQIATGANETYKSILLFEELFDAPITLETGKKFARDYEFRLECN